MSILKFSTIPEVVERANATIYGLGSSVWTNDLNAAAYIASRLENGTVWINCHNVLLPNASFGDHKQSGYGRDNSEYSLHEYTQVKCVNARIPPESVGLHARPAGIAGQATYELVEMEEDM